MKKIIIFLILTIMTLQIQAGRQELIDREKRKLLALRELVLQKIKEAGHEKDQNLQFKAEIRETDRGNLVEITEIASSGKKVAMAKDARVFETKKPERKKDSRAFYNDMQYLNP